MLCLFLPQAATSVNVHFLVGKISSVASLRDLIKDTRLKERDEKSPELGEIRTNDLKSFALQACALPLC